jgi:hypothetical protein
MEGNPEPAETTDVQHPDGVKSDYPSDLAEPGGFQML